MASIVNKLSAAFVARHRKVGRVADGGGLYLQVSKVGKRTTKAWLFRFALRGRERSMGLGSVNTFSLAEARERARLCRQQLDAGIDPIERRKSARAAEAAAVAKRKTFAEAATAFIADNKGGWRSAKHEAQWHATLRDYVLPKLAALPTAAIETAHVVSVLRPIWITKPETASRVRGRIESVLDWATANGFREGENPARWGGHLENILPKRVKLARVEHHAAVPYADIPEFMARVCAMDGAPARALETLVLTAVRTNELLGARWDEIDFATAVWTIPASRTKTHTEHQVPLSRRVLAILESLPRRGDVVFPSAWSPRKPLGPSQLRRALGDAGGADATLHGFRSSFRDWAGDRSAFPREVIEMALGHKIANKAEAAYRRGSALEKRRRLMEAWADYCSRPAQVGETVVALRA